MSQTLKWLCLITSVLLFLQLADALPSLRPKKNTPAPQNNAEEEKPPKTEQPKKMSSLRPVNSLKRSPTLNHSFKKANEAAGIAAKTVSNIGKEVVDEYKTLSKPDPQRQNSKTPVVKKYVEAPVKAVLTVGKRKADGTIGKVASDIKIKYNDDIKHLPPNKQKSFVQKGVVLGKATKDVSQNVGSKIVSRVKSFWNEGMDESLKAKPKPDTQKKSLWKPRLKPQPKQPQATPQK